MDVFTMQNGYIAGSAVVITAGMAIYRVAHGDYSEIPVDLLITTVASAIGQYGALFSGFFADNLGTGIVKNVGYLTFGSCITPLPGMVTAISSLAVKAICS